MNRNFCGYAHLHIESFITTKFHEILLSRFRGVALTNCFSSIFHFGQISKFKKGVTPRKNWIKISCGYAHLHTMSFITIKFHEILLSGFRGDARTDWRVKHIIPSANRCVGYNCSFGVFKHWCSFISKSKIPPRWRRGRTFASHAGDRGLVPGRDRPKS